MNPPTMRRRCWPATAVLTIAVAAAAASTAAAGALQEDLADDLDWQAAAPPRAGWLFVLPAVGYAPETGFVFGASAAYQRQVGGARPSTVLPVALLTSKQQLMLSLLADAWLDRDRWHLLAVLAYRNFPTLFYGIGDRTAAASEERFTDRSAALQVELTRRCLGSLYAGGALEASRTRLHELAPGGMLEAGAVPGAGGGELRGAGAVVAWDTRDAVQYPTRGWFNRLAVTRFIDALGGGYQFTATEASLARYLPLGGASVLAVGVQGSFQNGGEVPFYRLNRLGLRGYFEERHRDRHAMRAQVELRSQLWRRLGAVLFVGGGELAAAVDRLRLDETSPMAGGGLRFNVGGEQRVNLALDIGFGDGDQGVYVRFAEAF